MLEKGELKSLTGIRGVAATIIMIYHVLEASAENSKAPFDGLASKGYLSVDLFFVLSGFVLSYNYGRVFSGPFHLGEYVNFLTRRAARLYPLYWVLLPVYAAKAYSGISKAHAAPPTTLDLVSNILMLNGWGIGHAGIIGTAWSVSTELLAYLALPVFAKLIIGTKSPLALFCAYAASSIGLISLATSGLGVSGALDVVKEGTLWPALRCLSGFILGVCAYRIYADKVLPSSNIATAFLLLSVVVLAYFGLDLVLCSVIFPLLVIFLATGCSVGEALFSNRAVYYAGVISYSLYLSHYLFLGISYRLVSAIDIGWFGQHVQLCIFEVLLTFMASMALYHFVEVPGKRLMSLRYPKATPQLR
jgi:peptidoglycan/LPS O-acetylase OafA/YrhL